MKGLQRTLREIFRYPTAIAGSIIILILVITSIVTLIRLPYSEAVRLWRGGEEVWYRAPKNVPPAWINYFRREKLPETIFLSSKEGDATVTSEKTESGEKIKMVFQFDFVYDQFPQEMILYLTSAYNEKAPFVSVSWFMPDGEKIRITDSKVDIKLTYRFSQDAKLVRRLDGQNPNEALFAVPDSDPPVPYKGTYQIVLDWVNFEEATDVTAEFVAHGRVYGIAGTDHLRRDLSVALLWGIPVAMSFGLIAALGTTILTMLIAAVGVWYGGWLDNLIQRITEVNAVIPLLPILIMIGTFYSRSIFLILGVTILFGIFGLGIKTYRANFMQIKESPYIEAARAYGAGNRRLIVTYLIPRLIPLLIPGLVAGIPAFVFLEASLAVLGLGDPILPTWGKIIQDAQSNGALYMGLYYWVLEPAVLLMITGLAFAMLGFALDRIFNPRLRGM